MRGRWWKLLGLAGFIGVAATGAVIVRAERRRRAYTPEEIRGGCTPASPRRPGAELAELSW
jgi:hypothetical protein